MVVTAGSRKSIVHAVLLLLALPMAEAVALDRHEQDYDLKLLGKYIFFDKISNPPRMACVSCH
ncbi:MAG TPA: hypothetical protein VFY81_02695, partial [Gammaproteobacteria bacterium]|nr:hypothetical protein [Gammaproteobacteria bacterium]